MKIGINLWLLVEEGGGVCNYVLTLLRHWNQYFPDDTLVIFSFPQNETLLSTLPSPCRKNEIRLHAQEEISNYLNQFDLYFCPIGSLYPRPLPKPCVVTLVDIQERFYPQFFKREDMESRLHHYDVSLKLADRIITISEFSKKTFVRIVGISKRKIDRIYLCADEMPEGVQPIGWPLTENEAFIIYPANNWPHKNHKSLIEALKILDQRGKNIPCVFTGSLLNGREDWERVVKLKGNTDNLYHLGRLSRAELSWLYHHARILVFPSLFDGFGIPIVEAMESGLPIACADRTSLPEVAADAALFFNPNDPESIAANIERLWEDESLRERLIQKGYDQRHRFTPKNLVQAHRLTFERACRAYKPWLHSYRLWLHRRNDKKTRTTLTSREKRIAASLLK